MDRTTAEATIRKLYNEILWREPAEGELTHWIDTACAGMPVAQLTTAFVSSREFKEKFKVRPKFPLGHYYSPIVDPSTVRPYVAERRARRPTTFPGIDLSVDRMQKFADWARFYISCAPFRDEESPEYRYHYLNGNFPYGDAIILWGIVCQLRPRRIVEIGSGFSSACMLDAAEHVDLSDFSLTCIEPDPARLRSRLREKDHDRVKIIEGLVQDVPLETFTELERGDILFIDSTHVLKTGSDVHYELFEILPSLKPGVLVHFHDIQYPFEYPDQWIDSSYSWNEIYALRAFLMFNSQFKVVYWNSYFAAQARDFVFDLNPTILKHPGGSIWIEVCGVDAVVPSAAALPSAEEEGEVEPPVFPPDEPEPAPDTAATQSIEPLRASRSAPLVLATNSTRPSSGASGWWSRFLNWLR